MKIRINIVELALVAIAAAYGVLAATQSKLTGADLALLSIAASILRISIREQQ